MCLCPLSQFRVSFSEALMTSTLTKNTSVSLNCITAVEVIGNPSSNTCLASVWKFVCQGIFKGVFAILTLKVNVPVLLRDTMKEIFSLIP